MKPPIRAWTKSRNPFYRIRDHFTHRKVKLHGFRFLGRFGSERAFERLARTASGPTVKKISNVRRDQRFVYGFGDALTGSVRSKLEHHGIDPRKDRQAVSPEALAGMGYSEEELRKGGRTPRELTASRIFSKLTRENQHELRSNGFTPFELMHFGYSAKSLKRAGYSTEEIIGSLVEKEVKPEKIADYFENSGLEGIATRLRKVHWRKMRVKRWMKNLQAMTNNGFLDYW